MDIEINGIWGWGEFCRCDKAATINKFTADVSQHA